MEVDGYSEEYPKRFSEKEKATVHGRSVALCFKVSCSRKWLT